MRWATFDRDGMDDTEIYHNHRHDHDGRINVMHLITFDRDGHVFREQTPTPPEAAHAFTHVIYYDTCYTCELLGL